MFMWHEIESIEHSARNIPNVKSTAEMINGQVCTLNSSGAIPAPAAASTELYVVMQDIEGDDKYLEGAKIPAGTYVNLYDLAAWDGREVIVTEPNISGTYADIAVGDELIPDANGKVGEAGIATLISLKVLEKIVINGSKGVLAKIVKGEPTT